MPERQLDFDEFEALAAQVLGAGNNLRFEARGSSMVPFIRSGDVVEVQPVEVERLRPQQVVLCRVAGGRLVVHRVLQVGADGLLVQGDSRRHPDGRVPAAAVLGRVTAVQRGGRQISMDACATRGLVRVWLLLTPVRGALIKAARRRRAVIDFCRSRLHL